MSSVVPDRFDSRWTPIGLLLAVVLVLPVVLSPLSNHSFLVGIVTDMMIFGLFAMGYNLAFGHTGLLSFGHAAFFGTAAYVVALSLSGGAWVVIPGVESFVVAAILGVIGATVVAGLIGAVCVQRGEIYFAMLTLAFSMMLHTIASQSNAVTGGTDGIIVQASTVDLGVVSFRVLDAVPYYYFTFVLLLVSVLALWRIQNSSYGELLSIIRENPERAEFVGVRVKRYQWSAFVLSGFFAGMAGALASVRSFVVSPVLLYWTTSAEPVLMALLGGFSTFLGPLVGAVGFIVLQEVTINITDHWQIVLGIILIVIVLFQPSGLLGAALNRERSMASVVLDGLRNRVDSETIPNPTAEEQEES